MKAALVKWTVPALLVTCAENASAHAVHAAGGGGFSSGFIHPIAGLDHLAAMVAVGLWGGVLGERLKWQLPVIFPLVMAVGAALGVRGMPLPGVEICIALSGIVIGMAVVCRWNPPSRVAWFIVGLFAIFHGHAHGRELPHEADPLAYGTGFVMATGLLHLAGIGIGELQHVRRHGGRVVQAAGGIIAGAGCWYFYQAIAP